MTLPPDSWQAWIFDLDDTLLDTSGVLIPASTHRVFEFLVQQKAAKSVEDCLTLWSHWRHKSSGERLFRHVITLLEGEEARQMSNRAYQIFRTPSLPNTLTLRSGGIEILTEASKRFPIFLVTQGDIATQIRKVELLEIIPFFRYIYYVDPLSGESKTQAFADIIRQNQLVPNRVLSIGNRLDNEIALSKHLGFKTCYIRYGEHSHEQPNVPEQVPDYEITELTELLHFLSANEATP